MTIIPKSTISTSVGLLFIAAIGFFFATYHAKAASAADAPDAKQLKPLQSVARVDLKRYVGKWHQIALFPNRFQAQCISDTTATYRQLDDGQIEVKNRCKLTDGKFEEVIGSAKLAPMNAADMTNAKLKVRFAPVWLSWLPMVWGDYWVIDLDADYQYVAVSEPSRKFLWILSRTPVMEPAKFAALLERLRMMDFDTAKLVAAAPTEAK